MANDLTLSGATFAASATGFGQMLTGGTGVGPRGVVLSVPFTFEGFITTSSTDVNQAVNLESDAWLGTYQGVACAAGGANGATSPRIDDGARHHIAAVFTTTGTRIYSDGVLVTTTGFVSSPGNGGPGLLLQFSTFSGTRDEFRISSGERYNSAFPPPTAPFTSDSNTLALYHFDGNGNDSATGSTAPTVLPNASGLVYSPGNWNVTSASATSFNPSAIFRTRFTGASCTLNFDVSKMYTSDPSRIRYAVDGRQSSIVPLTSPTIVCAMPADTTTLTEHLLEVQFVSSAQASERWNAAASVHTGVVFTGLTLAVGATASAPSKATLSGLLFGDSISEPNRNLGATTGSAYGAADSDAQSGYGLALGRLLGAEIGVVGFSHQGYTSAGAGNVPVFGTAYTSVYSGVARSFTALDFVVVNQGTNDGSTDTTSLVTSFLNGLLGLIPSACVVYMLCPFNGSQNANIQAGIAACSAPARVAFCDSSGLTFVTVDGTHPDAASHLAVLAPAVASQIRSTPPQTGAVQATDIVQLSKDGTVTPVSASALKAYVNS